MENDDAMSTLPPEGEAELDHFIPDDCPVFIEAKEAFISLMGDAEIDLVRWDRSFSPQTAQRLLWLKLKSWYEANNP